MATRDRAHCLADAIESGHVGGAGIDVFEIEPPPDWRLARLPQVVARGCQEAGLDTVRLLRLELFALAGPEPGGPLVAAEHRREIAALPLALLFQIAAFMTPMLAITGT